jgi:GH15 family glucan-1,4-alpha-glucosidase
LGTAVAAAAAPEGTSAGGLPAPRLAEEEIRREFGADGVLVREAGYPGSKIDSAVAWAVRPFALRALYPLARRALLRIAAGSGRYGIVPSENWNGGVDPWTAPTAWTAWSLAALGERRAALRLMGELRRDATPTGLLPERVDSRTGVPASTTPLAWSHAFAILAIRQLWP